MNNNSMSLNNSSTANSSMPLPSSILMKLYFSLQLVETPPICAIIFVSLLNAWMVWRSALLDFNLKAILLVQSVLIFIYANLRIIFLFCLFTGTPFNPFNIHIQNVALFTITYSNLIGHFMIVERTMATIYARKYEHYNPPWISALWILAMIAIFIWAEFNHSFFEYYSKNNGFNFIALVNHVALVFSIFELIAFFLLNIYNRKNYNRFNSIRANLTHNYQLNERYQLLQNIYTGRQLAPSFIFHLLNIICSNTITFFTVYLPFSKGSSHFINTITQFIFVVHAFSKLGIEITVITFHPRLKRKLQKMLNKIRTFLLPFGRRSTVNVYQGDGGIADTEAGTENNRQIEGINVETQPNSSAIQKVDAQDKHFKMLEHFWQ